jgi:hypothetical protein
MLPLFGLVVNQGLDSRADVADVEDMEASRLQLLTGREQRQRMTQ